MSKESLSSNHSWSFLVAYSILAIPKDEDLPEHQHSMQMIKSLAIPKYEELHEHQHLCYW